VNERRPTYIVLALAASAVVGFVGAGLLDVHGDWGEPRQAAANILWIVFLLSVVGLVVAGARMLVHRRPRAAR
jgi:H+/Cl- antiporter ClcA